MNYGKITRMNMALWMHAHGCQQITAPHSVHWGFPELNKPPASGPHSLHRNSAYAWFPSPSQGQYPLWLFLGILLTEDWPGRLSKGSQRGGEAYRGLDAWCSHSAGCWTSSGQRPQRSRSSRLWGMAATGTPGNPLAGPRRAERSPFHWRLKKYWNHKDILKCVYLLFKILISGCGGNALGQAMGWKCGARRLPREGENERWGPSASSPVSPHQVVSPPARQGQPRPWDTIFPNFFTQNDEQTALALPYWPLQATCPPVQTQPHSPHGSPPPGLLSATHSPPPPCHGHTSTCCHHAINLYSQLSLVAAPPVPKRIAEATTVILTANLAASSSPILWTWSETSHVASNPFFWWHSLLDFQGHLFPSVLRAC